jgi:hypothetical protein
LTLLEWLRATGTLLAKLFLLAGQSLLALSSLSGSALRSGSALLTLLELLRAAGPRPTELLLLSRQTLLATLLAGAAWLTGCALVARWLVGRALGEGLAALLRLSLSALWRLAWTTLLAALLRLLLPAWLTLVLLLALILRVLLGNDEAAVGSTRAVKRDAQLRDRDRRHQGASEQDVAKLLQLPDGFEWQVPLLKCEKKRIVDARLAAPIAARLVPHCGRTLVAGSMASNEQFFRLAICPD